MHSIAKVDIHRKQDLCDLLQNLTKATKMKCFIPYTVTNHN